ncbi:DNA (cytosine-5)-methyltransferase 1 [Inhella inkyongensis]|uniref:DNA (cytosine-5-)-methyltransferase n=2 Tax=Inhella inkyongensis TaxID=392593 RepID=A0A840S180_9BURK|nr:DNA (cytosine-5)-methyltransferase 1 [Inhella inkyongensis]
MLMMQSQSAHSLKALSLFSSAGIGDLGVIASGLQLVMANELLSQRVSLYRENFEHDILEGDIWQLKQQIVTSTTDALGEDELFLLYATPPCQGMSSNGMGKLKSEISFGRRDTEDQRNRLIIPTMDIAVKLKPRWVLLENVPGMERTAIRTTGEQTVNIIDYVSERLGEEYEGKAEVVACEDYGIPQRRKRLITIFTRDPAAKEYFRANGGSFFTAEMREPRRTLREAIGDFPPLDAREGLNEARDFHPYHYVPRMAEMKHLWVRHTKEGETAFNNQCLNPSCLNQDNPGHEDVKVNGRWVSSKNIPIHCVKCGSLLPRPHVLDESGPRLLKGFHSAYRRMKWDEPARTLTQNFIYEASDNKIHPSQNRVLSVYEAMVVQTISRYRYKFSIGGADISTAKIAEVIGESVPPYLIQKICSMMLGCSSVRLTDPSPKGRPEEVLGLD